MKSILSLAAAALLLQAGLFAQTFGDISGEVRDPSAAAVSGATIKITNVATNATRTTQSNDNGL